MLRGLLKMLSVFIIKQVPRCSLGHRGLHWDLPTETTPWGIYVQSRGAKRQAILKINSEKPESQESDAVLEAWQRNKSSSTQGQENPLLLELLGTRHEIFSLRYRGGTYILTHRDKIQLPCWLSQKIGVTQPACLPSELGDFSLFSSWLC